MDFRRIEIALPGGGAASCLVSEGPPGAPLLHFAHANGFNAQTYLTLLEPLSDRFRIAASDMRGHGLSTLPAEPGFARGWRVFGEDLAQVLTALGGGPAILAGHSMGGIASLSVAAARPDLAAALILVEPVLVPALMPLLRLLRFGGGPSLAERAAKRRAIFASAEAMFQSYRGRGAFKAWPDEMLRDYIAGGTRPTAGGQIQLSCPPWVEAECFSAAPPGSGSLVRRVRCPVTLLHGDPPGSTCRPGVLASFQRARPQAKIIHVPGTGHFLPMERPQPVREAILAAPAHRDLMAGNRET